MDQVNCLLSQVHYLLFVSAVTKGYRTKFTVQLPVRLRVRLPAMTNLQEFAANSWPQTQVCMTMMVPSTTKYDNDALQRLHVSGRYAQI